MMVVTLRKYYFTNCETHFHFLTLVRLLKIYNIFYENNPLAASELWELHTLTCGNCGILRENHLTGGNLFRILPLKKGGVE